MARPSRWGNPFRIGEHGTRAECVDRFRSALSAGQLAFTVDDVRDRLAGKDLGCWCGLDDACHADVLLEFANSVPGSDQES